MSSLIDEPIIVLLAINPADISLAINPARRLSLKRAPSGMLSRSTFGCTGGEGYDKAAADYAVSFIQALSHTKGAWAGKPFELIDWQEQIVRDVFGLHLKQGCSTH
ncbi:MAG: hypothetical protein KGZ56_11145 [Dethiobacter sp.]|jgi:hypothetical protein|nr:hypothetical protein [Dethiobacter sp.]MBS3898996.1 hypothetical protein [Dethiobacter sp.]